MDDPEGMLAISIDTKFVLLRAGALGKAGSSVSCGDGA